MRSGTFASFLFGTLFYVADAQEATKRDEANQAQCVILPGSRALLAIFPYFCLPAGLSVDVTPAVPLSTTQLFRGDAPGANVTDLIVGNDTWRFACDLEQKTYSTERLLSNGGRTFAFVSFINGTFSNNTSSSCDDVFGELSLRELNDEASAYLPFSTDWDKANEAMGFLKPSHNVTAPKTRNSCEISRENDNMASFNDMIRQLTSYIFPYGNHCALLENVNVTACVDMINANSPIYIRFSSLYAPADARNDAVAKIYAGYDAEKENLTAYFEATEGASEDNPFIATVGNAKIVVPNDASKPCEFPGNFLRDVAKQLMHKESPVFPTPPDSKLNGFISGSASVAAPPSLFLAACLAMAFVLF
ncbi:MAG: hypothetical protein ABW189_02465 [Rickettsiales bacterium]